MPTTCTPCDPRIVRAAGLSHEGAYAVFAAALAEEEAGRPVIHLEIGQPDLPTPRHIIRAGEDALRRGETGYAPVRGLGSLREVIAAVMAGGGCRQQADEILVTPGGKAALHLAIATLVAEGDGVLVPDPGFSCYSALVHYAGGIPVPYRVGVDDGETLTELEAMIRPDTSVAILNFPHNPTGQALSPAGFERLAGLAARHRLALISDEVYGALQFDGAFRSLGSVPSLAERTVVVNSCSKSHAMTGFRLGWCAVPPGRKDVMDGCERIAVNTFGCVAPFVQHAGIAALDGPQTASDAMRGIWAARAARGHRLLTALPGVRCVPPGGGLYLFADVREALHDHLPPVEAVARSLLRHEALAVLPGTAFGRGGVGHLRLSLACSEDQFTEGMARLRRGLTRLDVTGSSVEVLT